MCQLLKRLPVDDLRNLGNTRLSCFKPMTRLTRDQAIGKIRCALTNVSDRSVRLNTVAYIYSCLIPKHVLSPWSLFYLRASAAESADYYALDQTLSDAMAFPGSDKALLKVMNETASYFVVLTTGPVPGAPDHDVVCASTWPELPFVAIHASRQTFLHRVTAALKVLLPDDPQKLFHGFHPDLSSAHSAALRYMDDVNTRDIVNVPGPEELLPPSSSPHCRPSIYDAAIDSQFADLGAERIPTFFEAAMDALKEKELCGIRGISSPRVIGEIDAAHCKGPLHKSYTCKNCRITIEDAKVLRIKIDPGTGHSYYSCQEC